MAVPEESILFEKVCRRCGAVFFLCRHCDRGHCYCCPACRTRARREQHRSANRHYQQTRKGRLHHSQRQNRYRCRQAKNLVTDHTSIPGSSPALSSGDPPQAEIQARYAVRFVAIEPDESPLLRFRCIVCGRRGRVVSPTGGWTHGPPVVRAMETPH